MNLLGLTAISYLGTIGVTTKTALGSVVEIGDEGYVFDKLKLDEYSAKMIKESKNDSKMSQKIIENITPGYNLYVAGKTKENAKKDLFEKGLKIGFLRPMTEEEKVCYQYANTKTAKWFYLASLARNEDATKALETSIEVSLIQSAMNSKYEQFKSNCESKIENLKIEYAKVIAKEKLENAKAQVLALTNKRK